MATLKSSPKTFFASLDLALPDGQTGINQQALCDLLETESAIQKAHISESQDESGLCIHYNSEILSLDKLKARLKIAGLELSGDYRQEKLHVTGMDCPDCATIIEHSLKRIDGVLSANVSYAAGLLRLEFDKRRTSLKNLTKLLKPLGYSLSLDEKPRNWWQRNYEMVMSLLAGVLLLTAWILGGYPKISLGFAIGAFISGGWLTLRDSIQTLLQKRFDIDVLMVIAAIGAASIGAWAEGALLLFLFSLGHALEHKALNRARGAVKALANLAPKVALVKRDGQDIEVPVEELILGDNVTIRPGQLISVDGKIVKGASAINQAPITGESVPVDKKMNDEIFAGSINGEGLLSVTVTKLAADTTLNRMIKLVLEADTQKSPTQRFTDQFVKYFVPIVLIAVIALIFIPPLLGASWLASFYRAMAVLVAASPCALAIATPAAILSGVARAAQKGVLIKGGMHLENLSQVRAIAFDKTGTLTIGKPEVHDVIVIDAQDESEVLKIAASVESLSEHPIAHAVVQAAKSRKIEFQSASDLQAITGRGLQAKINNQLVLVGAYKLFDAIPEKVKSKVDNLLNQGRTVMIIKLGDKWLGAIGVTDTVRPESKGTLARLKAMGIGNTVMLSGDNQRVAQTIADEIGITDVNANLLPEEKLKAISTLEKNYGAIAMVGDGVNDAPAMARATVGIAMGGVGSDVAMEASDVVLMADDLSMLPFAVTLSHSASRIIKQNLWGSLSIVAFLMVATIGGFAGIGFAVAIHEGSTLVVVLNALRLLRHKAKF